MKKLIQSQLAKLSSKPVFHKSRTLTFEDQDLQQAELQRELENIDFSYEMLKKGKFDAEQFQLLMGVEQSQIMPLFQKRSSQPPNRNSSLTPHDKVFKEQFTGSSTQAASTSNSFKQSKDKDLHVKTSNLASSHIKTSSCHPSYLPKSNMDNQKTHTRKKSTTRIKSVIAVQEDQEPSETLDKIYATDLTNTRAFLESINDISKIENVNVNGTKSHHCKTQTSLQCTFKPKILKKSLQIAQNLPDSFHRLTHVTKEAKHTYQQPQQRKFSHTRIQRLSQPRKLPQKEEEPLPSFKPNLSKTKISYQGGGGSSADVIDRNLIWLQQKEKKIQRMRRQEEQQKIKIESSAHMPRIKQYKGQNDVNLSNFGKQGIANYFQRVKAVKNIGTKGNSNTSSNLNLSMSKSSTLKTVKSKQKQKDVKKQGGKKSYQAALKDLHWKIQNLKI